MNRRELLKALLWGVPGAALIPGQALGLGPKTQLRLAQLVYRGGNPVPRPTGLKRLAWEVDKRTSIDVNLAPVSLRPNEKKFFEFPLLYMGGDKAFTRFSRGELARLHKHLIYGGMLLVDSADARPGGGFDQSVRELASALFPKDPLKKLDSKHTIHKSFYLLTKVVGRVATVPFFEGIELDGRLVFLYVQNDLAGAWSRDNFGQWEYGVYPGGEKQRELAMRWGINIVMYAQCLDYKADQVHIPYILKRRQWKVRP